MGSSETTLGDGRAVDDRSATRQESLPSGTLAPPALNPDSGTPAGVLDDRDASPILGKSVRSSAGEDMGRIVDVIVSREGQIHAAIIDFGGFLGIGIRKIAVDWTALNFAAAVCDSQRSTSPVQ
jgi:hypothetical protein